MLLRPALLAVSLAVFPICLSIAILQYHLFDLDLVINRALVWGALTLLTMGLYVLIVGALSTLFRTSNSRSRSSWPPASSRCSSSRSASASSGR